MVRPNARRVPGLAIQILLVVCVLGTIAGYWWGSEFDRAIPNIVALVTTFVAASSLLGWFAFRSSYPPLLRLLVPLSVVGVIVILAACFRIEETTGTLIPVLRPRWEPKADQKLSQPETEIAKDAIDLSPTESDFPRFLGPQGIPVVAMPEPPLARDWSTQPPKQLWKQPIGGGWGGFSVVHGYAVTLEQRGDEELVTCYEVRTGKLVWSHSTTTRHETVLGGVGPRSTPLIHDGRVYALGAHGLLRCLDGQTGKLLWTYDIYEKTGNTPEKDISLVAWGRSGSPLLVEDKVVIPVGGPPGGPFRIARRARPFDRRGDLEGRFNASQLRLAVARSTGRTFSDHQRQRSLRHGTRSGDRRHFVGTSVDRPQQRRRQHFAANRVA
jgi:hypothetical protein